MKRLFNKLMGRFFQLRYKRLEYYMTHPQEVQLKLFSRFIDSGKNTEYGRCHGLDKIRTYREFLSRVPVVEYDDIRLYVIRMMKGERNILWPGRTYHFSKSSGTTSDQSKYIPVSSENLRETHIRGAWDAVTMLYHHKPDLKLFRGRSLVMGGSLENNPYHPKTISGDVSALMINNMPWVGRPFYTPGLEIALMPKWEEKIQLMADTVIKEKDMTMFGGVPTWIIVLFRTILEKTGKSNILEVLPGIQAYIHGGVGFEPYKSQFREFLPSDEIIYQNVYNASEGYFAAQMEFGNNHSDMLLLLDNGIFYEFAQIEGEKVNLEKIVPLWEVEQGTNYSMIITNNGGLWRYMPGDTVMFSSTDPYTIKVTGRTRQYVNAFGEEVMIGNTDKAIALTCEEMNSIVSEYTVAPIYFGSKSKGGHQWVVEFEKSPVDEEAFAEKLDTNLQRLNSDYQAKRTGSMAMEMLNLISVPAGTFHRWMKSRGKLGGQNKVPRLSNDRKYIEEIGRFIKEKL